MRKEILETKLLECTIGNQQKFSILNASYTPKSTDFITSMYSKNTPFKKKKSKKSVREIVIRKFKFHSLMTKKNFNAFIKNISVLSEQIAKIVYS